MRKDGYRRKVDNKMHGYGDVDYDNKTIRINKTRAKKDGCRGEILDSIVHEEKHRLHPKMHEKTVKAKTESDIKHMGQRRKQSFYQKYFT